MRILPHPLISAAIAATWLLLGNALTPASLLMAALLAVLLPLALAPILPPAARIRRPDLVVVLLARVLGDIVLANLQVARRVLGPVDRIRSAFLWVPLDLRNPAGVATLAGIVTLTPGTLSAELSDDGRWLLVHALHVEDEAALVRDIKARYEGPLKEIFR